jgi:RNA polymerase sigma factor (sigma-70 family)
VALTRNWTTVTDGELIRLVQAGSPEESAEAFGALFDRTNRRLEAFLARGLGATPPEIAWVAEETWERALESLHAYEDRGKPFLARLCRIATNVWRERRRQLGKHPPLPEGYEVAAVDAWSRDPLMQLAERDDRHDLESALSEAIASLKPDQRAVLERRLVLGKSSREVADELGWTVAKVDTTLHRARTACRTYLLERFGLGPAAH